MALILNPGVGHPHPQLHSRHPFLLVEHLLTSGRVEPASLPHPVNIVLEEDAGFLYGLLLLSEQLSQLLQVLC